MSSGTLTRYQQLADELAGSIRSGVLRPGDRLPSVRDLRRQRGVSPSTIFQAYAQLESEGLVEARERSGYFVRARRSLTGRPPEAAQPSGRITPVAISELVFELLGSLKQALSNCRYGKTKQTLGKKQKLSLTRSTTSLALPVSVQPPYCVR